jgi:hypothetical protein
LPHFSSLLPLSHSQHKHASQTYTERCRQVDVTNTARGSQIILTYHSIDLPPTVIAKPLPVAKSANSNGIFTTEISTTRKSAKRKRNADKADDTPKAFARLMSFQAGKKLPKCLDDGVKPTKKQKKAAAENAANKEDKYKEAKSQAPQVEMPRIMPGEKMSEFSARVDAALPISGLINKTGRGGKDPLGLKVARTKTEKRMHRMYDEWREQDKKIKEKRQEALELAEEEEDEEDGGVKWKVDMEMAASNSKKKGKGKKGKVLGEVDDGDDDPWAAVAKARNEGPRKLNDVAEAPPQFKKLPREIFKAGGARVMVDGVPKAAGSLRRREELGEVRKSIVEGYRQMMKDNKAAGRQ